MNDVRPTCACGARDGPGDGGGRDPFRGSPLVPLILVSTAGHPRRRARRSWPQRLLLSGGVLVVTACLLAAAGVWYAKHRLDNVERIALNEVADARGQGARRPAGPVAVENYLIVGSDSRAGANPDDPDYMAHRGHRATRRAAARTRSWSCGSTRPRTSPSLLSLPRDLYVDIAGSDGKNRINAAFFKGPDVLIKTVQDVARHPDPPLRRGRLPGLQAHRRRHRRRVALVRRTRARHEHRPERHRARVREARRPRGAPVRPVAPPRDEDQRPLARGRHAATSAASAASRTSSAGRSRRPCRRASSNPLVLNELIGAAVDNLRVDKGLDLLGLRQPARGRCRARRSPATRSRPRASSSRATPCSS